MRGIFAQAAPVAYCRTPRNARVLLGIESPRKRLGGNMRGKICIVTGSNTGIGKETARGLAERGAVVVLACRDLDKAEAARADIVDTTGNADVYVLPLDLVSIDSIHAFVSAFRARWDRLDVLVNNAGVTTRKRALTNDGFELTFGVNHLGTALLTLELRDLLEKSAPSRIVVVATELARDYPRAVMAVVSVFLLSPERGAACSLHVATSPDLASVSGEYFDKSKPKMASPEARDEAAQERLWTITEKLLGGARTNVGAKEIVDAA